MTLNRRLTQDTIPQELVLTRVFNARRALVFQAWTNPEHVTKWWGPGGFDSPVCQMDARPGGTILIHMRAPDGIIYPMSGIFHEVVVPERLVFTSRAFEDANGNPALEVLHTITFVDLDGKTRVTLRAQVVKAVAEVAASLAGMEEGWQQSLDKLDRYLAETNSMTGKTVSRDGTPVAFDRSGQGPAVILVSGALGVRAHPMFSELAELLSQHFTVINYDRRGRGDSGDTPPYAVEREIEDIEALIDTVGGPAYLYGLSSGAVLALEAANRLPHKVKKLALYEPPFIVDNSRPPLPDDYVHQLNQMIAEDRRGDAVALFMQVVGVPEEFIPQMREMPMWPEMEQVAHTLAYDGTVMGDNQSGRPLPRDRWKNTTMPTLVIVGEQSEPFFYSGSQALVEVLPNSQQRVLAGQSHEVAAAALAPVLVEFFAGQAVDPSSDIGGSQ